MREYSRTLMLPIDADVESTYVELESLGLAEFDAEGIAGQSLRSVDLRYQGQGYELNIPYGEGMISAFHALHKRRYGFSNEVRPVEIVNVRVRMIAPAEPFEAPQMPIHESDGSHALVGTRRVFFSGEQLETRLYERDSLRAGDTFAGPAIISEYSSRNHPPARRCAARRHARQPHHRGTRMSPIELAIFQSSVHSIAEEMGAALRRTSISPNIKERRDYSCALFDGSQRVIAMGDHMPVHLGSMPLSVEAVVRAMTLEDGDIAILNDPYAGGTHLPDITLVLPIFVAGISQPSFYAAVRAHHADVGGTFAGSMGPGREIYQEGIRIPPIKLIRGGQMNVEILSLILHNVRTPEEREGDLAAQIGACRVGERRLHEIVAKYGLEKVNELSTELLAYSERLMRAELRTMPAGTYEAEDFLDSDGITDTPIRIAVAITFDPVQGSASVDFSGSSPQAGGSINAVFPITYSACFYVFRCLLADDAPATAGLMNSIQVSAPAGTIVNARPPAAVAGGNVEASQRIVDVLLAALAKAAPNRVPAASYGTMSNLTIGGIDSRTQMPFTYYETTAGGMGARPGLDGIDGIHCHMTNSLNTPVEALEYAYPFRVRSYSYRPGSGGKGEFKGGDGIIREIELLADAQVTLLSDRRKFQPYGLSGGHGGEVGRTLLIKPDGSATELPAKCSIHAHLGDLIRIETPGGGGWGVPRTH